MFILKASFSFTDIEMRLGYLGHLSDLPGINGHLLQQQSSLSDLHRTGHPPGSGECHFMLIIEIN